MNEAALVAIGAIVYGVIREIGGQIVSIKKVTSEQKEIEFKAHEQRMIAYVAEVKKDYEEAKEDREKAEVARKEAEIKQVDCEKNTIRLEARIELLIRLSGIDLNEPKVSKVLQTIEKEKEKEKGSKNVPSTG